MTFSFHPRRHYSASEARSRPCGQCIASCIRGMKLVVFGLTITSSWGNGHATLWRGLVRALGARGHRVVFFERDVPYYAMHRDLTAMPGHMIQLYDTWDHVHYLAARHVRDADVAMVTSYCPDAVMASQLVL